MKTRSWLWIASLLSICAFVGCNNDPQGNTDDSDGPSQPAVCGDGILAESEDCDDSNTVSGDGCSDTCMPEPGYDCSSGTCELEEGGENCGNGVTDTDEVCDDGNTISGDGCMENCLGVEQGWTCPTDGGTCEQIEDPLDPPVDEPVENVCGDGTTSTEEQCDDGNTQSGDGCTETCQLEPGWDCPPEGGACTKLVIDVCGDGNLDTDKGETCDDGNKTNGDGCSKHCLLEKGYACEGTVCATICGDGIRAGLEACDDGGTADGDGCKSDCSAIEEDWICMERNDRTFCVSPSCGDNIINGTEQCDYGTPSTDENGTSYGWSTSLQGPYCYLCNLTPYCGDGIVNGNEQCDKGLHEDGTPLLDQNGVPVGGNGGYNGCLADCTLSEHCGDGSLNGDEKCDQGTDENGVSLNVGGYNGCKNDCSGPELFCGDGIVNGNEQCDQGVMDAQGNLTGGTGAYGGCLSTCHLASRCGDGILDAQEACDGEPGCTETCVYGPICGDGHVDAGEACDEGMLSPLGRPMIVDGTGKPMGGYGNYGGCMPDCSKAAYCGDGKIDAGEICDDGNNTANDGCAANCHAVEKGWTCDVVSNKSACSLIPCGDGVRASNEACDDNEPGVNGGCLNCQPVNGYMCMHGKPACPGNICNDTTKKCELISVLYGDGIINSDFEKCDDGNTTDGDGCTDGRVDPGYSCIVAGELCVAAACGDGILARGEACDDGNVMANDGCSNRCKKEEGYLCTTPGTPCVKGDCGDNIVQHGEECDNGNKTNGDGCSATCTIEAGYVCLAAGGKCTKTTCGDAKLNATPDTQNYNGYEQCDDGDKTGGDGCSATCRIETGYHCTQDSDVSDCTKGKCRDGIIDAGEECDDGNTMGGDGCDPMCKREAIFECDENGQNCKPVCGDGITLWDNGEDCDDGNLVSGDGCSSVCTREAGFKCTEYSYDYPGTIQLPAVYRDFRAYTSSTCTNMTSTPVDGCIDSNMVSMYGKDFVAKHGHPDFENINASENNIVKTTLGTDGLPVFNKSTSTGITQESFQMWYRDFPGINKTIREPMTLNLVDAANGKYRFDDSSYFPLSGRGYGNDGNSENYHFTTHIQTYFKYRGNKETLSFRGDDDVWVFVNGIRAIDLGGCHNPTDGSFTLTATTKDGVTSDDTYKLYKGGIYAINFFQAERKTSGSNFKLELAGFLDMGTTMCASICGDGIVAGGEQCDVGNVNNEAQNIYGCVNCVKSAVCGNGRIEEGEACDTGHLCKNSSSVACTGITYVEDTDCIECEYKNCGNGHKEGKEECDCKDGVCDGLLADEVCLSTCRKSKCGDGIVDPNNDETCDLGAGNGPDAACTQLCNPPVCGDGIVSSGEACDDGINDGAYGHCGLGCSYVAPACGDGIIQTEHGETCDNGALNNDNVYNGCTTQCKEGPRCGDGKLHPLEQCDNGDNNRDGLYGGCSKSCTRNDYCGDGIQQAAEECDNGVANVDPASNTYNRCTTACKLGSYCGDGVKDATEECDNGQAANIGGYGKGLCNPNCTLASYCGDGRIDATHAETCDNGANNADDLYNGCTTSCQFGPHCGDGIVNGSESCDGTPNCTQFCTSVVN